MTKKKNPSAKKGNPLVITSSVRAGYAPAPVTYDQPPLQMEGLPEENPTLWRPAMDATKLFMEAKKPDIAHLTAYVTTEDKKALKAKLKKDGIRLYDIMARGMQMYIEWAKNAPEADTPTFPRAARGSRDGYTHLSVTVEEPLAKAFRKAARMRDDTVASILGEVVRQYLADKP